MGSSPTQATKMNKKEEYKVEAFSFFYNIYDTYLEQMSANMAREIDREILNMLLNKGIWDSTAECRGSENGDVRFESDLFHR